MQHKFRQTFKEFQFEQEVPIVLVSRQVQVETGDQSNQKLSLARLNGVDILWVLLAVLEQKIDSWENRLWGLWASWIILLLFDYCALVFCLLKLIYDEVLLSLLNDFLVIFFIFRKRIEAKHGKYVHVKVVNHEANVTKAARSLNDFCFELAPQNQIDENLSDLLESLQVYVFRAETRDDDGVKAFLVDDLVQNFFAFREQREALAS